MKQIVVLGIVAGVMAGVIGGVLGTRQMTGTVLAAAPEPVSIHDGCARIATATQPLRDSRWDLAETGDRRARERATRALRRTEATLTEMGWTTPGARAQRLRSRIDDVLGHPLRAKRWALDVAEFDIRLTDQCRDARAAQDR